MFSVEPLRGRADKNLFLVQIAVEDEERLSKQQMF